MIRPATIDDVPALVGIGQRFVARYPGPPVSLEHLPGVLTRLIGTGFVAVDDQGGVRGVLVGTITPTWLDPTARIAIELAWWHDVPGSPGGIRLLRAFEAWAAEQRVPVMLSDLVSNGAPVLGDIVERLGYQTVERAHYKEVATW